MRRRYASAPWVVLALLGMVLISAALSATLVPPQPVDAFSATAVGHANLPDPALPDQLNGRDSAVVLRIAPPVATGAGLGKPARAGQLGLLSMVTFGSGVGPQPAPDCIPTSVPIAIILPLRC
jgi:hypothetical protein